MAFLSIVAWTGANRVAKYLDHETEAQAQAHVAFVLPKFPDAFVASRPASGPRDWLIDPVTKTLSVDIVPPVPPPTKEEIYNQVIKSQLVLKGYILAVNDGSIIPGGNMGVVQIRAAVKAKM